MQRFQIKIGDVVSGDDGEEFRVERTLSDAYVATSVNAGNLSRHLEFRDVQLACERGLLNVRPRSAVASAREVQEARYRRVACETLLGLIASKEAERSPRSVAKAMPAIKRAWFLFMLNDMAYDKTIGSPFARAPSPAAILGWLASYDGSDASQEPSSATRRRRDPLEAFDAGTAEATRSAAASFLGTDGVSLAGAHRAMCADVASSEVPGGVPSLQTFRRVVERMAYEAWGRNASKTAPTEPERWDAVPQSPAARLACRRADARRDSRSAA